MVDTKKTKQTNKQTNGQVPRPKQTGQEARMGLLVLMVMQCRRREGRRNKRQTDQVWPGRQASKHVASQSLKEDPPPRPSHLQVEGEKRMLLNAGLFSGTPGSKLYSLICLGNHLLVKVTMTWHNNCLTSYLLEPNLGARAVI